MEKPFLLYRAARHNCKALRQAAIPLAATNFDRIDPSQLMLLTAKDMKELLSSDTTLKHRGDDNPSHKQA